MLEIIRLLAVNMVVEYQRGKELKEREKEMIVTGFYKVNPYKVFRAIIVEFKKEFLLEEIKAKMGFNEYQCLCDVFSYKTC